MPEKVAAKFEIKYFQVMDEKSDVDEKLMPKIGKPMLQQMYASMVLARKFDEQALKLQRQGRIGTYASHQGQEACQIGSVFAFTSKEWLFPSFRENAALIALGVPMHLLYAYWGGDERGSRTPDKFRDFPVSIPVGSQPLHAVGAAWAAKLKGSDEAMVVYFGDGATSQGDFHEAMNFAGVFNAPVVFICQNNQYAISVPREKQTASQTLAQKAIAYGFEGLQVDGNDVFGVYKATKEALEKAKAGKGPTMIECITYRLQDHTTADDASRYRSKEEVEKWKSKEPLQRLEKYLLKEKIIMKNDVEKISADAVKKVDKAVEDYEAMPAAAPTDMFDYLFAKLPFRLGEQRVYLEQIAKEEEASK